MNWKKILTTRFVLNTLVLISVILGVILPIKIDMPLSLEVKDIVHLIENAEPGTTVLFSSGYSGSTIAETEPIAVALIRLCFLRDIRVMTCGFFPEPSQLAEGVISTMGRTYQKKPGEDYIHLGLCYPQSAFVLGWGRNFRQQMGSVTIANLAHFKAQEYQDFLNIYPQAESILEKHKITIQDNIYIGLNNILDTDIEKLGDFYQVLDERREHVTRDDWPIFQDIEDYGDILCCGDVTGTSSFQSWIIWSADYRDEITYFAGVTAISAPEAYQFLQAGQMIGVIPGYRGATEIETHVNKKESKEEFIKKMEIAGFSKDVISGYTGGASRGMPSLALVHICILLMVLVGNIQYFMQKGKQEEDE